MQDYAKIAHTWLCTQTGYKPEESCHNSFFHDGFDNGFLKTQQFQNILAETSHQKLPLKNLPYFDHKMQTDIDIHINTTR